MVWSDTWLWVIAWSAFICASILLVGDEGFYVNYLGYCGGSSVILALIAMRGALPLSKAGVRSTSFGITPRFRRLNIPSLISFSVIGGGSAKGSSRNAFGRIRLGLEVLPAYLAPIPNFSSSILLIPPWCLPYLNLLGWGNPNFVLIKSWPTWFSGSLVK